MRLEHLFIKTWDFSRDLKMHKKIYSLDVRIHHRIWDAQKHLLPMFVKLMKRMIEYYAINLKIQLNFYKFKNSYSIKVKIKQRVAVA